jgi:hypothetical protein
VVAAGAALISGPRTARVLLVILAGLLVLAAIINLMRPGIRPVAPPAPTALPFVFPGVEATAITDIVLEDRRTGLRVTLNRIPGDWLGTDEEGRRFSVDLPEVARLLRVLSTLRYNRTIDGSALEAYGLSEGGWFIVQFQAGDSYTLHIGDDNPDRSLTYVQRGAEGPVLLVSADAVAVLTRTLADPSVSSVP